MSFLSQLGAKDKPYIFTLEEIKKTGVLEKCSEVKALREENLNAKADRLWEEFAKKHPKLFTVSGINGDLFGVAVGGKWVPVLSRDNADSNALCQESDAECRTHGHSFSGCYGSEMEYHIHVSFGESKKSQEKFEQAVHDRKFLEFAVLFSVYEGLADALFDRHGSGPGQCSFMEEGYINVEAIVKEISKESFKPLEKEAKE